MMSTRDRFRATVNHEPHPHLLYYAKFTPAVLDRLLQHTGLSEEDLDEHFGMFAPASIGSVPGGTSRLEDEPDLHRYYADVDVPDGAYVDSHGVLRTPGSLYHFTHRVSPLRNAHTLSEIEAYPFRLPPIPDPSELRPRVEQVHAAGGVSHCWIGHMYETAWQVRGYEQFLMDMAAEPDNAEFILETITRENIRRAEAAAHAGVDYLRTGDDVAHQTSLMFSKDMWRRFIKTRWARVYEAARRIKPDIQIWYHSDGDIREIIPELIDIGVTILNPVQPECMDVAEIKRRYGTHLVLDGTIGTQTTMPFGSEEDVRTTVRQRAGELGYDGALILSPTHVLEPEVPAGNILAFLETCRSPEAASG